MVHRNQNRCGNHSGAVVALFPVRQKALQLKQHRPDPSGLALGAIHLFISELMGRDTLTIEIVNEHALKHKAKHRAKVKFYKV